MYLIKYMSHMIKQAILWGGDTTHLIKYMSHMIKQAIIGWQYHTPHRIHVSYDKTSHK